MKYCEWVDVGFIHEKLVCKHCDSENLTGNHKLEKYCKELEYRSLTSTNPSVVNGFYVRRREIC